MRKVEGFGYTLRPSETGDLFCRTDWAKTALGAVTNWPEELKAAVALCLNSQFPMTVVWGEDLLNIYNDGYLPIVGAKHPQAFAIPALDAYPEIAQFLDATLSEVMQHGTVIWEEDFLLPLVLGNQPEECYFTFCYSPLSDASGAYRGAVSIAISSTSAVLEKRRMRVISALSEQKLAGNGFPAVRDLLLNSLRDNPMDCAGFVLFERHQADHPQVLWATTAELREEFQHTASSFPDFIAGEKGEVTILGKGVCLALQIGNRNSAVQLLFVYLKVHPLTNIDASYLQFAMTLLDRAQSLVDSFHQEQHRLATAQRQLDSRDVHYRLIFENAQDGIMFTTPGGDILAANQAACSLLGFSEQEIISGGRDRIVVHDEHFKAALTEREETGRFSGEFLLKRKNGSSLLVDASSIVFNDHYSQAKRALIIFRDATARKLTEERNSVTAKLEAVGRLTGGISHDFNNYLNVIINSTDDLLQALPARGREHAMANLILSASLKAADLTRQLLTFSRREKLLPKTISVPDTLTEIDQILSRAIGENIELIMNCAQQDLMTFVDPSQFQSAILNLVINARDAMPNGGVLRIDCSSETLEPETAATLELQPGSYVRIAVSDTGCGIAQQDIGKVFEPFYTTKTETGGTGLGLSMTFGFIRQSQGGIDIQSTPGQGTTVNLYLPHTIEAVATQPLEAQQAPPRDLQDKHIFIVEDNELVSATIMRVLDRQGYSVTVFSSGTELLEASSDWGSCDLLITDVILGTGIDGWTLADRMKEAKPDLPIIVMTGFMEVQDGQHPGAFSYPILRKPFRGHEVLAIVSEVLSKPDALG